MRKQWDVQPARAAALVLSGFALMGLLLPGAESLQRLAAGQAIMSDTAMAAMLLLTLIALQWGWRFQAKPAKAAADHPRLAHRQLRLVGGTDFEARTGRA